MRAQIAANFRPTSLTNNFLAVTSAVIGVVGLLVAVLLVSHRFSSVRSADRIFVLNAGRLVEQGSHDELLARVGQYAELFTLQAAAYLSAAPES